MVVMPRLVSSCESRAGYKPKKPVYPLPTITTSPPLEEASSVDDATAVEPALTGRKSTECMVSRASPSVHPKVPSPNTAPPAGGAWARTGMVRSSPTYQAGRRAWIMPLGLGARPVGQNLSTKSSAARLPPALGSVGSACRTCSQTRSLKSSAPATNPRCAKVAKSAGLVNTCGASVALRSTAPAPTARTAAATYWAVTGAEKLVRWPGPLMSTGEVRAARAARSASYFSMAGVAHAPKWSTIKETPAGVAFTAARIVSQSVPKISRYLPVEAKASVTAASAWILPFAAAAFTSFRNTRAPIMSGLAAMSSAALGSSARQVPSTHFTRLYRAPYKVCSRESSSNESSTFCEVGSVLYAMFTHTTSASEGAALRRPSRCSRNV
mmetsp:Transcript_24983/g.50044  ORF Transcript_24983/g.50044 Transcript_24983/m.50044 type:complete len:382 (-) Transcript_24983:153-1298(-)